MGDEDMIYSVEISNGVWISTGRVVGNLPKSHLRRCWIREAQASSIRRNPEEVSRPERDIHNGQKKAEIIQSKASAKLQQIANRRHNRESTTVAAL